MLDWARRVGHYVYVNVTSSLHLRVKKALETHGPLKGSELQALLGTDPLPLWRACMTCPDVIVHPLGRQFLRLDRSVENYARLSPSIRREFLTYTLIGLERSREQVLTSLEVLDARTRDISAAKRRLAMTAMTECLTETAEEELLREHGVFILAGDIVHNLAHDVPRPELSTGQMVRGSDLDIVFVADEQISPPILQALDDVILKKKHYLLVHPHYREEIDYVIKTIKRVEEQIGFDTFEHMVACKILYEGEMLHGSRTLFDRIKQLLEVRSIPDALRKMEQKAEVERQLAIAHLLTAAEGDELKQYLHLFYTREEKEEIY